MPLNKFAGFGTLPHTAPAAPGLARVLQGGFDKAAEAIAARPFAPTSVDVPSALAFLAIWSLGPVRDALTDQGKPNVEDTNAALVRASEARMVDQIHAQVEKRAPSLAPLYREQFRQLDRGPAEFDAERRERLAELIALEVEIAHRVHGPPSLPAAPASRGGRRS